MKSIERPALMETAEDFLYFPGILDELVSEVQKFVIGEEETIRAVLLHISAIWVENTNQIPHILVNSESSSGKSFLCKAIIKMLPDSLYEYRTKITPEAFTYWHNAHFEPEWSWNGKVFYLEDARDDIINGSTFKVMCSEGAKSTVLIKQKPTEIEINGRPLILLTSANTMPSSEIINRFSIINLDETPEQTKRIMKRQTRDAIMGKCWDYDESIRHALSLLKRVTVRLPDWIENVSDYFPNDFLKVRRDFPRFLDLMKASAALHQKQRSLNIITLSVEANEDDYNNAVRAMKKIETAGGVFGLTHRMKKAYTACVEFYKARESNFCAKDMYAFAPIVSEIQWTRVLEKLANLKLLGITIEKNEETNRNRTVYYPSQMININFPPVSSLKGDT